MRREREEADRIAKGVDEDSGGSDAEVIEDEQDLKAAEAGKEYLLDTAVVCEGKHNKATKKNGTFGWAVFNQDSLYRAHKKRTADLALNVTALQQQKQQLGDDFYDPEKSQLVTFVPDEDAKDRLQADMAKQMKKRKNFSRRRTFVDEEDVSYINNRNAHFNKKLDRAFKDYAIETKQNLERGTAL
eukprot:GHVU01012529.1.p2 GENE.GHVU01012529.1~~GHVU01012529.1.p2  ORF type:complete len:186 (+),score=60.01 GHVU01012529.1:1235-1792(+)